jgi:hypothetical protein
MNTLSYSNRFPLKAAPMTTGVVLLGTGSLIGMAGLIVGGHALMSASRRWFMAMADQPQQRQSMKPVKPRWTKQPKVAMATEAPVMAGNGTHARSGRA